MHTVQFPSTPFHWVQGLLHPCLVGNICLSSVPAYCSSFSCWRFFFHVSANSAMQGTISSFSLGIPTYLLRQTKPKKNNRPRKRARGLKNTNVLPSLARCFSLKEMPIEKKITTQQEKLPFSSESVWPPIQFWKDKMADQAHLSF